MDTSEKIVTGGIILATGALVAYGAYEAIPSLSGIFNVLQTRDGHDGAKIMGIVAGGTLGLLGGALTVSALRSEWSAPWIVIGSIVLGGFGGFKLVDGLLSAITSTANPKAAQAESLDTTNENYVHKLTI